MAPTEEILLILLSICQRFHEFEMTAFKSSIWSNGRWHLVKFKINHERQKARNIMLNGMHIYTYISR